MPRGQFFADVDAAYRRLPSDPEGWAAELDDRAAWESTLGDGLGEA